MFLRKLYSTTVQINTDNLDISLRHSVTSGAQWSLGSWEVKKTAVLVLSRVGSACLYISECNCHCHTSHHCKPFPNFQRHNWLLNILHNCKWTKAQWSIVKWYLRNILWPLEISLQNKRMKTKTLFMNKSWSLIFGDDMCELLKVKRFGSFGKYGES